MTISRKKAAEFVLKLKVKDFSKPTKKFQFFLHTVNFVISFD